MLKAIPRVLLTLPVNDHEGLVVAEAPDGTTLLQFEATEERLRSYSAVHPLGVELEGGATEALARVLLRKARPDLAAVLDPHERRGALRLVGGTDPEAA